MAQDINAKVQALIDQQVADGTHIGTQVSAYRNGEPIVDAWAGTMGPDDGRSVGPDTLFLSFSTTKGVAATMLHMLADQGIIDYDAPVARYWPAFAANGKENVTVAQAMSHQAGLHAMPERATLDDMTDWERGLAHVAGGPCAWEPGTATGYHAITYAWVVGGIVEGATGKRFGQLLREMITEPLGIADEMFVGIPDGVEERLTTLGASEPSPEQAAMRSQIPPDHDMLKAMPASLGMGIYNDMALRRACLPSANGHFSARALAKTYGALANGGEVDGVRLVSPERVAAMSAIQTREADRVIMMPIPKSIGFFNGGGWGLGPSVMGPRETAFGHPGAGGSVAFADPEVGLAVAVTLNKMQNAMLGEGPTTDVCNLIRTELGVN